MRLLVSCHSDRHIPPLLLRFDSTLYSTTHTIRAFHVSSRSAPRSCKSNCSHHGQAPRGRWRETPFGGQKRQAEGSSQQKDGWSSARSRAHTRGLQKLQHVSRVKDDTVVVASGASDDGVRETDVFSAQHPNGRGRPNCLEVRLEANS